MVRRFPALTLMLLLAACAGGPRPAAPAPGRLPERRPPPVAPGHTPARPPVGQAPKPAPKPAPARPTPRPVQPQAQAGAQGRVHVVQPGDTGIGIARAYGIRWSELVALNGLVPPFAIRVGDRLKLPSQQAVASRSIEERARAFDLDIDDIVTGGEPASPARKASTAPAPPAAAPAPLPALPANAPRFQWPVEGRVLLGFGPKPGGRFNDGVNLKAGAGQAVRAAGDGVVAYAGDAIPAFGNLVLIKHGGGWVTAYAHNEALLVQRGQRVRGGDVIARAGQTGDVKEPQLHFELRRGRTPVDPVKTLGGR